MSTYDFDQMLDRVRSTQWFLADFDWSSPGAERIRPEQREPLRAFMIDLMWIEHVGARAFASMVKKAPNDTLKELYRYFHAEEQRHANAEMALLRRWGMLEEDGAVPAPNNQVRLLIEYLDRHADDLPLGALGAVIPMLEIALDGALCKFMLDTVDDPLCQQVFSRINEDESRHLAVGFKVLELLGHGALAQQMVRFAGELLSPTLILGILAYMPLLNRMRDNVVAFGVSEDRLYQVMRKYQAIGRRSPTGRRNPWFRFISWHGRQVVQRSRRAYHVPVDGLVRLGDLIPPAALPTEPSWVRELTQRPAA